MQQQQQNELDTESNVLNPEFYFPFPLEIVENILLQLVHLDVAKGFQLVNGLNRFTRNGPLRKKILFEPTNGFDMDNAARRGLTSLLDWWLKESGLDRRELVYSRRGVEWTTENNHVHVVEWFYKAELWLDVRWVVDTANSHGRLDVLRWLKKKKIPLKYGKNPIEVAFKQNHPQVMEWWLFESGEPLVFSIFATDMVMRIVKERKQGAFFL